MFTVFSVSVIWVNLYLYNDLTVSVLLLLGVSTVLLDACYFSVLLTFSVFFFVEIGGMCWVSQSIRSPYHLESVALLSLIGSLDYILMLWGSLIAASRRYLDLRIWILILSVWRTSYFLCPWLSRFFQKWYIVVFQHTPVV